MAMLESTVSEQWSQLSVQANSRTFVVSLALTPNLCLSFTLSDTRLKQHNMARILCTTHLERLEMGNLSKQMTWWFL
jgi:hypothetical protein